jgi:hypothetical protein
MSSSGNYDVVYLLPLFRSKCLKHTVVSHTLAVSYSVSCIDNTVLIFSFLTIKY